MTNFFFGPQQAQQLIDTMRVIHLLNHLGDGKPDLLVPVLFAQLLNHLGDGKPTAKFC
mgnify:CR=1 FL=1